MSSIGINYDNMPSPFYQQGANYQEKGESNLFPYLAIRGTDIFDENDSLSDKSNGSGSISGALNRFVLNISPLNQETYPNYGNLKTLVNLDTAQLYSPNPKVNYKYGGEWQEPNEESCSPYYTDKDLGVYENPAPARGAPVEFKKVYFRGKLVDREKGYELTGASGECRTFHAIFACSNPIEQTIYQEEEDCDEPSGTLYNPRDENFSHSDYAIERSWEEIDIFCGEGGSGASPSQCNFQFSSHITGGNYQITCSPGTVNGLLPSNFDSVAQIPTGDESDKYIYLDIDTDGKNITSASFEVSSSVSSTAIRANEGGAQDNLKILAGAWIDKSLTSVLCQNISICPEHVFSEDDPANPYFPKRWYQWRIDTY